MRENEAQQLQEELKELERIISFRPSEARSLTTTIAKKLSAHAFQSAANQMPSTSVNMPIKQTDQKKQKDETDETVPQELHPKDPTSTDDNKTVSNPQQIIRGSGPQPLKVMLHDVVKALDEKHVEKPQSSQNIGTTKGNSTLEDCKVLAIGPQDSQGGDVKKALLPGSPPSMNPFMKKVASDLPPKQVSQPPPSTSTNTLQTQQHPMPEKEVDKPRAQDPTPPSAPRNPLPTGRETQNYRPSWNRAPVDRINERRRGGNTRLPSPIPRRPSLPPPALPSSSNNNNNYYRPRDPDLELEKFASRDRDLQDWLVFTGWHNRGHRADFLQRKRRLAELDRGRREIEQERARLMSAEDDLIKTDDFYASWNTGSREPLGSPTPRIRKREYIGDYEDESPRKMSRQDNREDRRDLSARATGDYGKRGYYHEEVREDVTRLG
ncbi:hypothetical protein N0V82_010773, partial [Gnomoniopsis sp. IMI 355080]